MGPAEVFLSHSDRDRDFAARLAELMVRHGVPVWYSRRDIVGAQQWHDEIGNALRRCDWFAVILSPEAIASRWVKRELLFALQDNRYENRIVPILYRQCTYADLSWTLSAFQLINATEDFEEACRELLRVWGIGYRPLT